MLIVPVDPLVIVLVDPLIVLCALSVDADDVDDGNGAMPIFV